MDLKEYQVMGCSLPTKKKLNPEVYKMRIFAKNEVTAKSKFSVLLSKLKKIKKTKGEILSVNEIFEKKPMKVKIYGVFLRYNSRSGTHNMYKEYLEISKAAAVSLCYKDMAARHRAAFSSIQIIRVSEIKPKDVRRPYISQIIGKKLEFPNLSRVCKPADKSYKRVYYYKRPVLF